LQEAKGLEHEKVGHLWVGWQLEALVVSQGSEAGSGA
jgi:hypothetical protein